MDVTINHGADQVVFNFIKNTVYYTLQKNDHNQDLHARDILNKKPDTGNYIDLTSKNKKIMISMPTSVYHFFIDFAGKILKQAEKDKDLEVIVSSQSTANSKNLAGKNLYLDTLDLFKLVGIKVTAIDFSEYDGAKINNLYVTPPYSVEQNYELSLFNATKRLVKNKSARPFRKVFLSRRRMGDRQHLNTNLTVGHDNRIDSHDLVEEYFQSLGFEIVEPERFASLQEQVNFFYETKVLVSTTSSGLINSVFMQEGQTVIELQTPLIVYMPRQLQMGMEIKFPVSFDQMVPVEQLHFFYVKMAFHKKHTYVAINNYSRSTEDIKQKIENDPYLKSLVKNAEVESNKSETTVKKRKWLRQ